MAQRPVTLTDIVRGHVSLEIEGFDRLYFNGWVAALQTSGQVVGGCTGGASRSPRRRRWAATARRSARRCAGTPTGTRSRGWSSARATGSWRWCGRTWTPRNGPGGPGGGDRGGPRIPVGLRRDKQGRPPDGVPWFRFYRRRTAGDLLLLLVRREALLFPDGGERPSITLPSQRRGEAGGSLSAPRGAVVYGWRWKTSISSPPQRWGEAGGSPSRGSPGRTGAASTKSRRLGTAG